MKTGLTLAQAGGPLGASRAIRDSSFPGPFGGTTAPRTPRFCTSGSTSERQQRSQVHAVCVPDTLGPPTPHPLHLLPVLFFACCYRLFRETRCPCQRRCPHSWSPPGFRAVREGGEEKGGLAAEGRASGRGLETRGAQAPLWGRCSSRRRGGHSELIPRGQSSPPPSRCPGA